MAPMMQQVSGIYRLVQQMNITKVMRSIGAVQPMDVMILLKNAAARRNPRIPEINSDFYDISDMLSEDERVMQRAIREFMEQRVRPIINDYWERGEFPHELVPAFARLMGTTFGNSDFSFDLVSPLMGGVACMEMARGDPSVYTFFGVQWGLAMGSIYLFGSDDQKARWLPQMMRFEKIGSWSLTEPQVGSAAAAGLTTTARREGDSWLLNGEKKWSGNAPFADVNVVFARDVADNQVKAFLVERGMPGYNVEKLQGKMALRVVQNANIRLVNCRVAETSRLPGCTSFRDVARQLGIARSAVAWAATGLAMGAYERTLHYATHRYQFGRPIAGFQLVQSNLVQMVANITAMQTLLLRLAQLHARDGKVSHERSSLAKMFCCEKMRETVALGRSILGGNGILLEHEVGRYFADAEAIYSYEGTHEMNTLIVGKAITGTSAFI